MKLVGSRILTCENAFRDFDLERVSAEPGQEEEDFGPMYFISWQHSLMWLFTVLI